MKILSVLQIQFLAAEAAEEEYPKTDGNWKEQENLV